MYTVVPYMPPAKATIIVPMPSTIIISAMGYASPAASADSTSVIVPRKPIMPKRRAPGTQSPMSSDSLRPARPLPKPPKMSPLNAKESHAALARVPSVPWHVLYGKPVLASTPL